MNVEAIPLSLLDPLVSHLSMDLTNVVKSCWIDPTKITLGHLLGKGTLFTKTFTNPTFGSHLFLDFLFT